MPAKRDTQLEAARLRHLSPHQTAENQSQAWGIRFHSCTWREGLAPSWKTELRDEDSSRDLPGDYHLLSINGSHVTVDRRIAPPTAAPDRRMIVSSHAAPQYPDACHAHLAGDTPFVPTFSHHGSVH